MFLVIQYLAPIKVVLMAVANRTLCCSSSKLNVLGSNARLECYGMQHSIFIGDYTTEIHSTEGLRWLIESVVYNVILQIEK